MTFNAAMNSIPVLLTCHRGGLRSARGASHPRGVEGEEMKNPQGRTTLRDFDHQARSRAIRQGTVLTSIALMIAITTDIVGFLVLPSLFTGLPSGVRNRHRHRIVPHLFAQHFCPAGPYVDLPTKKLPLEKAGKITVGPVSKTSLNASSVNPSRSVLSPPCCWCQWRLDSSNSRSPLSNETSWTIRFLSCRTSCSSAMNLVPAAHRCTW